IKFENEKLIAYNTDYFGLIKTFEKMGLILKNKKVVILGTGGASKACIKALSDLGAIIYVVSRNIINVENELKNVFLLSYNDLEKTSGYLLINATPVGTTPNINTSPVKKNIIQNFDFVLDLIYNPKETLFLKYAKDLGKTFENGLYMLISQGIKSQEIWNEREFNYEQIYNELINTIYK
ncbi:MAG: shikimate dehydrogenase family protein, partial [Cetobacterium sp.]